MEEGTPSPASRPPLPRPTYPLPLTYIIQVPKDQIYRIPPKENARLADQYRSHLATLRSRHSPCLIFALRFLCLLISIALLLIITTLILYIVVRPTAPIFNIDHVVIESKTQYEVFMEATNPSFGMEYLIEKGIVRAMNVSCKQKSVTDGESPHLILKAKESKKFKLLLHGVLKKAGQLRLMVKMPVRVEIWSMRLWGMKMKVECDMRLKSLGKGTEVLSQECKVMIGLLR